MTLAAATARVEEPLLPRSFVVDSVRSETVDTTTLRLRARDGEPVEFRPGQFTMIGRPGHAEIPISISGDPTERDVLVHTVRAVGDASAALASAQPGDTLWVRGPYGMGWDVLDGVGGDVIFVAGGIGLAPLRPAVLEVLAHRSQFGKVSIVYGSRSPDQLLYSDEVAAWRGRFDLDVEVTVDVGTPHWRGHVGLVTSLLGVRDFDPVDSLALACGPETMMRLTAEALVGLGADPGRVRVSMERNMKCGVGLCGHCQIREVFACMDGPVMSFARARDLMSVRGL